MTYKRYELELTIKVSATGSSASKDRAIMDLYDDFKRFLEGRGKEVQRDNKFPRLSGEIHEVIIEDVFLINSKAEAF